MHSARSLRAQRGLTLVELMIAIGVSSFLLLASMSVHIQNISYIKSTDVRSTVYQDTLLVSEYLRTEMMASGGGAVRAWMGLWVENNCVARGALPDCANSDRLNLTNLTVPLQECQITSMAGPGILQVAFRSPGVCCMQPVNPDETSFQNRSVVLTLNDFFQQRFTTAVDLVTCRATVVAGQASGGDVAGGTTDWSGGTISLAQTQTVYWNSVSRTLRRFIDADNDNIMDAGEDLVIADRIFDFQMALGFDFNPADGNVNETIDGINDEWLFNAPTIVEAMGTAPFIAPLTRAQVQFVTASTISGVEDPTAQAMNRRTLNGPLRGLAGWFLEEDMVRLAPRNQFIFQ